MSRYQGVVPLDGGSLETAAHEYFRRSEQIPTRVRLAVAEEYRTGADGLRRHWRAGGILAQFLPRAPERMRGPDLDVEALTLRRDHAVSAGHEARRGRERHAARVFERLARLEHRLLAHDAGPAHLLGASHGVGDAPVARLKLHGLRAAVDDLDRIGPEILTLVR